MKPRSLVRSSRAAWMLLCALTLLTLALLENGAWPRATSVGVALVAMVKARLVLVHFMELPLALPHWRQLYGIWIVVATAILIIGYIVSLRLPALF